MTLSGAEPESRADALRSRKGIPFTVYFSEELSAHLKAVAEERKIARSVLVREGVERLLRDLESGQLDLPLGL